MTNLSILLMAGEGSAEGAKSGGMINMVIMLGMVAVLYFFMIRPQMKKAKQQKEFASSNGDGDKIVTISGLHGKIIRTNEDGTIQVDLGKTIVKMERSAISMEMTKALQEKANAATNA